MSLLSLPQRSGFQRGAAHADPNHLARPLSVEEIQSEVLRCAEEGERLRVAGGGTAANALWRTDENLMTLDHFQGIESADLERGRVWVRAGTQLAELSEWLLQRGLSLPLDGWAASATIGGAVTVGAHGSGPKQQNLSAHVSAVGLITADGVFRRISNEENSELFDAARLSLGALGVVSHLELSCQLARPARLRIFKSALEDTLARLPELHQRCTHLSFEWFPGTNATRIRSAMPTEAPVRSAGILAEAREWGMNNAGHWLLATASARLPRFSQLAQRAALQAMPESEQIVAAPRPKPQPLVRHTDLLEMQIATEQLPNALAALERLMQALEIHRYAAVQVGFIAADTVWLSPAYKRNSAFIRLKQYKGAADPRLAGAFIDALDRFDARPHWGSPHKKDDHDLASLYPRWTDFLALREQLDPRGLFLNDYLCHLFGLSLP